MKKNANNEMVKIRKPLRLTQNQFAALIGVSVESVHSIESGRMPISDKMWVRLATITKEDKNLLLERMVVDYRDKLRKTLGLSD